MIEIGLSYISIGFRTASSANPSMSTDAPDERYVPILQILSVHLLLELKRRRDFREIQKPKMTKKHVLLLIVSPAPSSFSRLSSENCYFLSSSFCDHSFSVSSFALTLLCPLHHPPVWLIFLFCLFCISFLRGFQVVSSWGENLQGPHDSIRFWFFFSGYNSIIKRFTIFFIWSHSI